MMKDINLQRCNDYLFNKAHKGGLTSQTLYIMLCILFFLDLSEWMCNVLLDLFESIML